MKIFCYRKTISFVSKQFKKTVDEFERTIYMVVTFSINNTDTIFLFVLSNVKNFIINSNFIFCI